MFPFSVMILVTPFLLHGPPCWVAVVGLDSIFIIGWKEAGNDFTFSFPWWLEMFHSAKCPLVFFLSFLQMSHFHPAKQFRSLVLASTNYEWRKSNQVKISYWKGNGSRINCSNIGSGTKINSFDIFFLTYGGDELDKIRTIFWHTFDHIFTSRFAE